MDLGEKVHRHRPLSELSLQAAEIMCTVLDRVSTDQLELLHDTMPRFFITETGSKMLKSAAHPTARSFIESQ